ARVRFTSSAILRHLEFSKVGRPLLVLDRIPAMSSLGIDNMYLALASGQESGLLTRVYRSNFLFLVGGLPWRGFEFTKVGRPLLEVSPGEALNSPKPEELTCNHHYHTIDHPLCQ
ncbi:hypothetical protein HAX54_012311, partial [Datura stramonium]|nr:hypothetical protein [Datura stramonium]